MEADVPSFCGIEKYQAKAALWLIGAGLLAGCMSKAGVFPPYYEFVLITLGINIILTLSLNLVNGYMGEFSVGHAGFMAIGAYVSAYITARLCTPELEAYIFPFSILLGGCVAALGALLVAIPSFRTRGDYLAIVTIAFMMIVKSAFENMEFLGGARGLSGISKLSNLGWTVFFVGLTLVVIRNIVSSRFGRGIVAVREDELAASLAGIDTRHIKLLAFCISGFFAGVAGALYAHSLQYIAPKNFDIIKSTEMLVMVYLGGVASLSGSLVGASVYTVLMEVLRPMGIWRMVCMPLVLVLLMIFRPTGLLGYKEISVLRRKE